MKTFSLLILFCVLNYPALNAQCPVNTQPGIHTVQKGETLYRIATQYNIGVEHLLLWNQMHIDDFLIPCQNLYVAAYAVPARSEAPQPTRGSDTAPAREAMPQEFSTGTNITRIETGPALRKQAGKRHVVQVGETIAGLADLYGYTEKRFRELNVVSSPNDVTPGSIILSSDCTCDRINYDNMDGLGFTETNTGGLTTTSSGGATGAGTSTDSGNTGTTSPPRGGESTAMSSTELSMVDEINLMRANPSGYVRYIREYVADQKANNGFPINDQVVNELIEELRSSPVLSNLQPKACVYMAAQKHGQDLRRMGRTDHQGSDGSWPWDRVLRACPDLTDGNENLVGGPDSVRESVVILLIDDGIPNRGHRKTLMRKDWNYVACYKIGKVGDMPNCWVQQFAY